MRGAPRRLLLPLLCAAACALKPIQRRRLLATTALLPASQAAALAPKPSPPPPPSYVREDVAGSPGDLRAYRLLRFASGLRVLLASDASARDATVAATVGAGQLREPVEGLSHLTEHLVMRAGDLEAVAASFDGNANAYTAFDCTTYVASCFPSRVGRLLAAYGDALSPRTADRFDGATARREVKRVDAELKGPPRGAALELELLRHRAVGPLSRFGPGTKTTLLPRGDQARDGDALASAAASLYRARYVAEDATVAVVAPIPLDLLERAARNLGSPLRDGPPPRPPRKPRDPLPALERGSNVVVASGRDVLSLTWSVPYESLGGADAYRRAKPCATVSHVLGHGGPGSLQAKLRAMAPTSSSRPGQPALSAGAFLENDDASGFALFHVRVFLQRSAQWEEALAHALGAVAALRLTPLPLWKDAADECARLADLQWRFPPRPPTASELANDMRCADFDVLGARRYAAAPRDAALAASRFADLLTPERCRVAACLSELDARTVRAKVRRSALTRARRVRYFDVDVDVAAVGPAAWWKFPRPSPYVSRLAAGQVNPAPSPFAVDSAAASPVSIDFLLEMAAKRQPQAGAAVERVPGAGAGPPAVWIDRAPTKPGAAPRAKLVLWLPAARVAAATAASRAAGRLWQLRVDVALAEPLYDAALAGCKYEFAFLRAAPNAPGPAAGARVALAAYADVLPRFAVDYARRLGELAASPIPAADLARAKAFALLEPGLGESEKRALSDATEADVRAEAAALWNSAARAAPAFGEALVAAEDADAASAKKLVAAVYRELLPAYVPLATARAPAAPPADRPSRLLASRNSWDHPVAANACVASGVPGLLANCNVR